MARDLNYRVTVDSAAGEAGIRSFSRAVNRELATIDKSMDDAATGSQRVAAALGKLADEARSELTAASRAADALGTALGPELAAQLGRNGIVQYVGDLTKMGLTFEDVEADANELAASIRKIEDVKVDASAQGVSNLGGRLSEVDDAARGAGSAMANMIGNTTQDIAGLTGVTGSLGVALGQMGEYAADAAIGGQSLTSSLGQMAKVAGPIGALGIATKLLTDAMNKGKEAAKAHAEGIERISDAAAEGTGTLGALRSQIADTGKLAFTLGGGFDFAGLKVDDLRTNLDNAGMSLQDFVDLTGLSRSAFEAEITSMKDRGVAEKDLIQLAIAYEEVSSQVADAELNLALNRKIGADATENAAIANAALTGALEGSAAGLDENEQKGRKAASAMDRMRDAYDKLTGRIDAKRSVLDLRDQFDQLAEAGLLAWDAATKGEADAEQKARDYQRELYNTQSAVADYAEEIYGLPAQRTTDIIADIDDGSIRTADQLLERLAREREALIRVRVANTPRGTSAGNAPIPMSLPPSGPVPAATAAGPDVDGWAPMLTPAVADGGSIIVDVPVQATPVTVDMRGAILSSRYDIVRLVRGATRDGIRLGGRR